MKIRDFSNYKPIRFGELSILQPEEQTQGQRIGFDLSINNEEEKEKNENHALIKDA